MYSIRIHEAAKTVNEVLSFSCLFFSALVQIDRFVDRLETFLL